MIYARTLLRYSTGRGHTTDYVLYAGSWEDVRLVYGDSRRSSLGLMILRSYVVRVKTQELQLHLQYSVARDKISEIRTASIMCTPRIMVYDSWGECLWNILGNEKSEDKTTKEVSAQA